MNQLDEFFIKFTTTGLADLKQGMDDINKKLDEVGDSLEENSKKGESFFGKMPGWLKSITGLGAAFVSLRGIINGVFDTNSRVLELNTLAATAGTSAENLEALSVAIQSIDFRANASSVANDLATLNDQIYEFGLGRYSEAQEEVASMLGMSLPMITPGASVEQQRAELMNYYTQVLSSPGLSATMAQRFRDVFGISDTMASWYAAGSERQAGLLDYGRSQSVLSRPGIFEAAVELNKASAELKRSWDAIYVQLQPLISNIITHIINPLVQWLGDMLEDFMPEINAWVETAFPKIQDFLTRLWETLIALFEWAFGDGSWENVKGKWQGKTAEEIAQAEARSSAGGVGRTIGAVLGGIGGLFVGHPFLGAAGGAALGNWAGKGVYDMFNYPALPPSDSPFLDTLDVQGTLSGPIQINVDPSKSVSYAEFTTPVDLAITARGTK